MSRTVDFKFDILNKVKDPMGNEGIVTSLSYSEGGTILYYFENSIQGVTNKWWAEEHLTSVE